MRRAVTGWCVCALAFATGVLTAALAAENRARGDELDRYERWCEAQSRRNDLLRVANQRAEWQLLSGALEAASGEPARPRAPRKVAP